MSAARWVVPVRTLRIYFSCAYDRECSNVTCVVLQLFLSCVSVTIYAPLLTKIQSTVSPRLTNFVVLENSVWCGGEKNQHVRAWTC